MTPLVVDVLPRRGTPAAAVE